MRECENHQSAARPQVVFFVKLEKLYFIRQSPLCAVLISRPFSIGIMGLVLGLEKGENFCALWPHFASLFYNNGKQENLEYLWASL